MTTRAFHRRELVRAAAAAVLTAAAGRAWAADGRFSADERRAIELIIQAFREEKDRPVPGSVVALTESKQIHVDVAAAERKYGVAYVTAAERVDLGTALPEKDPAMGDALQLVSGLGDDGDARVLVLRDSDYLYDDHVGEQREQPSLTAELKLKRDVHDFIVRAHAERWP